MDTLPDELLFEVINQLYLEDVAAVWNISIANRHLHRIAKELLYRCYSLDDFGPGLFIRTLASSPNLERCVQHIDWDCRVLAKNLVSTSDAFKLPEALTTAEFRHISERVGFDKKGRKKTMTRGKIENLNAWLAGSGEEEYFNMFMLFTSKVKTIFIARPWTWSRKVMWFKPALDSQIFTNLHKADINGGMRIGNVLPLFLLPSMRTLKLSHISIDRNQAGVGPPYEWEVNTAVWKRLEREGSSIEHLHLPNVGTDTLDISRMLGSFTNLKDFEFALRGHGLGEYNVDLRTLLCAIAHHHTSLTSLTLQDHRLEQDPS